jgi:hypothetical protein
MGDWGGHDIRSNFTPTFSYEDLLRILYTFYFHLYVGMIYGQELEARLQKSDRTSYVAPEKTNIIRVGVISVMLHLEVTLNCNSDISDKTWYVWLHFCEYAFYLPLINECLHPLKVVKLLLELSVYNKGHIRPSEIQHIFCWLSSYNLSDIWKHISICSRIIPGDN